MRRKGFMASLAMAAFLAASCRHAKGHGFVTFISTPVSPPTGFEWMLPVSLVVLGFAALVLTRLVLIRSWMWASIAALVATATFGAGFKFSAVFAWVFSTGPPPMLGPPCKPFVGWGWQFVGAQFVIWNLAGMTFFLVGLLFVARVRQIGRLKRRLGLVAVGLLWVIVGWAACFPSETGLPMGCVLAVGGVTLIIGLDRPLWRKATVVLGVSAVYCGLLIPFVARNALSHGWTGVYVWHECSDQIGRIGLALVAYAEAHEGALPEAETTEELLQKVAPYLQSRKGQRDNPIECCPALSAYQSNPPSYTWDHGLSGRKVCDLQEHTFRAVLRCPLHRMSPLEVGDLLDPEGSFLFRRVRPRPRTAEVPGTSSGD